MADQAVALSPVALPAGVAPTGQAARQRVPVAAAVGRGDAGRVPRLAGLARPDQGPRPVGQPAVRRKHGDRACRHRSAAAGHLAGDLHAGSDRQPLSPAAVQPAAAGVLPGPGRADLPHVHLPARGDAGRAGPRRRGPAAGCSRS